MDYRAPALCAVILLAACGGDEPGAGGKASAPAPAAPAASAPAETATEMAADEEEFTYDPIDVSKLENQWWQQYSSGG